LHRVFPWLATAQARASGHALFVPRPQGAGRIDNPGHYDALYLSSTAAGAVAEAFGNLKLWTPRMFVTPAVPGSVKALATYELPSEAPVLDLDDAGVLASLGLRPSQVVTRARDVTQPWALAIFQQRRWIGVRWWSYYDARWYSYGLWELRGLTVSAVVPLTLDHAAVVEAAQVLRRPRRARQGLTNRAPRPQDGPR